MKILFTVQGEGRGHLTQALAISESLSRQGHELTGVVVGRNSNRELPPFFTEAFGRLLIPVASPGFVFRAGRSVDVGASLRRGVGSLGKFREGIRTLRETVAERKPDLIINFFEPLTGLAQLVRPLAAPVLSIAHQFMIPHPEYVREKGHLGDRLGVQAFVQLVGLRSRKLALSLTAEADYPEKGIRVCPPLLRRELFALTPTAGSYYLVYVLNHAYAEEIAAWQRAHPDVELHCFYDRPGAPAEDRIATNLTFHALNGHKFLKMMAGCRAVVCTAGFESISEAAWLGKPVLVVPVEGHAEQRLNALDTVRAGFGIADTRFNLDRLGELPSSLNPTRYRAWVASADRILDRAIAEAARVRGRQAGTAAPPSRPHPSPGMPRA